MAPLLLVLALALPLPPLPGAPTAPHPCPAGCDDHNPCTQDRCANGTCIHTALSGTACDDHDPCTEHDTCQAGTCIGVPMSCPDDGFSCTDEACVGGECTHVPVDSRCVSADTCTTAVCAPERHGHAADGCAPGPPQHDGAECAEDGDACTADVCGRGQCVHEEVADQTTCTAVETPFRLALSLEITARGIQAAMSPTTPAALVTRAAGIRDALGTTARVLAGKAAAATSSVPGAPPETPLQQRARGALGILVQARPQIAALVQSMNGSSARARLELASDAGKQCRFLLRGTRVLRGQLRRLLRVQSTFVR